MAAPNHASEGKNPLASPGASTDEPSAAAKSRSSNGSTHLEGDEPRSLARGGRTMGCAICRDTEKG
jgi:hypothetical protein